MTNNIFMEWREEYSVGIPKIDNQHQGLIKMINDLFEACKEGEEKANEVFKTTMKELVGYIKVHFKTEEDLLTMYGYPEEEFKKHKNEHEKFVIKILENVSDFESGKRFVPNQITSFLKDWLLNHIAVTDKKYSLFLQEKMK